MNQKDNTQICNHADCNDEGLYKAPINKYTLNKYQWFCLEHIKEFNKSEKAVFSFNGKMIDKPIIKIMENRLKTLDIKQNN